MVVNQESSTCMGKDLARDKSCHGRHVENNFLNGQKGTSDTSRKFITLMNKLKEKK